MASSILTMYRGRMKGNKTETKPTDPTLQKYLVFNIETTCPTHSYLSPVKFEILQLPSVEP